VIYPVSASAEAVFRQALVGRPDAATLISGEATIVSALKALVNGRVKAASLEVLENAWTNPQITEEVWKTLCDKQGATKALKDGIYGSRNVRLLTLKAILMPRFLPTFLAWLKNSNQSDEHYSASLVLQSTIFNSFTDFHRACPQLTVALKQGIGVLLNYLIEKPQVLMEAQFLLTEPGGLWLNVWRSLSLELENDFGLMKSHAHGEQNLNFQTTSCDEMADFLGKTAPFWLSSRKKDARYLALAQLFEEAAAPKLSAVCYQFAEGSVPKSVFFRVCGQAWYTNLFGLQINRRMSLGDYVSLFLSESINFGGIEMPRAIAGFILLITFTVGFFIGWESNKVTAKKTPEQAPEQFQVATTPPPPANPEEAESFMTQEQEQAAKDKLKETQDAIENIKRELKIEDEEQFNEALEDRLGLTMSSFTEDEVGSIKKIYEYQKRGKLPPDGIISEGEETQKKLKEGIEEYLKENQELNPVPGA
jgi:hypothetical protein